MAHLPKSGIASSKITRHQTRMGFLFISPWLFGLIVFNLGPILAVFILGFTDYPIIGAPKMVGLANYKRMFFDDPLVLKSVLNTLYYVGLRVPFHQLTAFFLAILVSRKLPGRSFFRTGIYLPVMIPAVAKSVIWRFLLGRVGLLNYVFFWMGLPTHNLLSDTFWVKPIIVLLTLWIVGITMIIYLAGLQGIPRHLYESAEIDGAGAWHKLINVTVPMMTPVILLNVVIDIINSFQVFVHAYIITEGGPMYSSLFYVLYIFQSGFEHYKMGYASALATVLFIIILVFTVLFLKWSESWVHYEQV
ncbi:MAG TPA: sugar ABC transporter permease [Spirochaetia bacterium]|nr:sugar ABC transporter permease [Spirochaetia bacterium]